MLNVNNSLRQRHHRGGCFSTPANGFRRSEVQAGRYGDFSGEDYPRYCVTGRLGGAREYIWRISACPPPGMHRCLIHHVLAERRLTPPGMVFPMSSVMLDRIDDYRTTLQAHSIR
ncbi:MAG: hypothetical protein M3Y24_05780 [Acidobacteriota bacterium]|nr:hypothetical protein [Acidobacteriota bacterium]